MVKLSEIFKTEEEYVEFEKQKKKPVDLTGKGFITGFIEGRE